MQVIHTIRDIPPNPDGLCALSSNDSSSDLAYPGSSITGEIQIFDTINLVSKRYNLSFCETRTKRSVEV